MKKGDLVVTLKINPDTGVYYEEHKIINTSLNNNGELHVTLEDGSNCSAEMFFLTREAAFMNTLEKFKMVRKFLQEEADRNYPGVSHEFTN
jgi:hypothetical protein